MFVKVHFFIHTFLDGVRTPSNIFEFLNKNQYLSNMNSFKIARNVFKNKNINNEVNNLVHFDKLQVGVKNEIEIILTTSCKYSDFLKEYHTYQNIWGLVKGEIIQAKMESMNSVDKYAVAAIRGRHIIRHWKKGTYGKFAKKIFYFLNVMRTTDAGLKLLESDVTWVMEKECESLACYTSKEQKFILID